MANGGELHGVEGDRSLATSETFSKNIPGFTLKAQDAATLMSLLVAYGPYANGETALFWHIVGLIGKCREVAQVPEPEGGWRTPAGKLLGVEIEIPNSDDGISGEL